MSCLANGKPKRARRVVPLGDEGGTGAAVEAVDGEITAIHGEDSAEAFAFCDAEEGGIDEVHGTVDILTHEFADAWSIAGVEREELQGAAFQHLPESFLGPGQFFQQVHGFGQRRPNGGHRLAKSLERRDTPGMMLVIGINEGDERPSIDEDQRRLRRRLFRSLAKRRPVCAERLGFPPWTTPMRSVTTW